MENVMMNGFVELSSTEMETIDGGSGAGALALLIVGGILSFVVYEIANAVCEDFTGKTIGKHIADCIS